MKTKTHSLPLVSRRVIAAALAAAALGVSAVHAQSSTTTARRMDSGAPTSDEMNSSVTDNMGHSSSVARADRHFIEKAAAGGKMEVKLGQLAQERAADAGVKAFGQRLATDHTQANNELKALAQSKGIIIEPSDKADRKYDKLSAKDGEQFDKAYIKLMVEDHKKDIKMFEDEAENGKDSDVRAFAGKTLPTLREHLAQAESLKKKID